MRPVTTVIGLDKINWTSNKLFVCSVRKEDGAIFPLSIHLDKVQAQSNLAWMKVGCLAEDTYQILDMATVDISKLCLQCYVKDVQDKMMIAFKKAQGISL